MVKKKAAPKKAAESTPLDTPNKREAIKAYLSAHKGAKAAEVIEALKGQGIDVSANYISIVKGELKGGKSKSKKAAVKKQARGNEHGNGILVAAAAFVKAAGGITAARNAITIVEEIAAVVR